MHIGVLFGDATSSELDPTTREMFLGLLKGVTRKEAENALVKFGNELVSSKVKDAETFHRR